MDKKLKRKNFAMLIATACFLALTGVFALLSLSVEVSELWSTTVSRAYRLAVTWLISFIPFSVTEWLIVAVVIAVVAVLVAAIVLFARRKAGKACSALIGALLAASVIGCLYFATAGFEYRRAPLEGSWTDVVSDKEEFYEMSKAALSDFNALAEAMERDSDGNLVATRTFAETAAVIRNDMLALPKGYLSGLPSVAKPVVLSVPMSYMGISGMYLSLSGESNINTVTSFAMLPHTVAHELSHSMGVMRENEANVLAAYVTLNSADAHVRYSGYIYYFNQILRGMGDLYGYDSAQFAEISLGRNSLIIADTLAASAVWNKYDGWTQTVSEWFNDMYLKMSGAVDGTGSYETGDITVSAQPKENGDGVTITVSYSQVQKILLERYRKTV